MRKYLPFILFTCVASGALAQQGNFPSSGTGGVNPLAVAPNNKDIYVSPNCGTQTNCSSVKGDVKVSYTGTITNGSPNFSCSNTDPTCALASGTDVGKQILVTNGCPQGGSCLTGTDVQFSSKTTKTTIATVTSATAGTMSQNASSNIVGTAVIAWGTPDGANLTAAYSALTGSARGTCGTLELPNAMMFTNTAEFINGPSSCFANTGLNRQGVLIKGVGISSTWIIPTNDFNFGSCTGPDAAHSVCFCDNGSTTFAGGTICQDFSIMGLGQSLTGTTHAVSAMGMESNNFMFNVNCVGWGGGSTSMRGLSVGNLGVTAVFVSAYNIQFDGCGSTGLLHQGGGPFYLSGGSYFGDNLTQSVNATGSGTYLVSTGNGFGPIFPTAGAAILNIGAGAKVFSSNDTIGFGGCNSVAGTANVYTVSANTQVWLEHDTITAGCTSAIWTDTSSATAHVRDSLVTGSTNSLKTTAGTAISLDGGNTLSPTTIANAGNIFGATNEATGTACATGNFALTSGWGTSSVASVSSNGNIQSCHVTITGAAGSAGPVLTWTYPAAPIVAPASCYFIGTTASLTQVQVGVPGATSVAFTFVGTPTTVTYQFDVGCR